MTETLYIINHQGFRQHLAGKWFSAAYPDPDNLGGDPSDVDKFAHPTHETLTVEWFRYMRRQIGAVWGLDYWPGASEADKALEADLCAKYHRMKAVAEAEGYRFDEKGNILSPPVAV